MGGVGRSLPVRALSATWSKLFMSVRGRSRWTMWNDICNFLNLKISNLLKRKCFLMFQRKALENNKLHINKTKNLIKELTG